MTHDGGLHGFDNQAAPGATWRVRRFNRLAVIVAAFSAVTSLASANLVRADSADGVAIGTVTSTYDPTVDPYSMAAMTAMTNVDDFWDQGYTGAGIDVALIDTGVAPVEGLTTPGKIVNGPDLSFESQIPEQRHLDTNGHGTFMAGIIAGKDATMEQPYSGEPADEYRGVAPDARIINVKVGAADGAVDVTQVIAAINWVVDHKNDNGMNIRVLNISYGTNSMQPYFLDPLAHAVERAWHEGIVVVAAAGNTGYQQGGDAPGLASPAYNPWILAVGGYDHRGTADIFDDQVGMYSARATRGARRPDVVAPGSRLQGLRVANSFTDVTHSYGRLGDRYFRGSGTSEAAAWTSGLVALLLQKYPDLHPDQVKQVVRTNVHRKHGVSAGAQGAGFVRADLLAQAVPGAGARQNFARSIGMGSIELSRGRDHLTRDGRMLIGEVDIFGLPWTPGSSNSKWSGGLWNGLQWSGGDWSGSSWSGSSWSGSSWSGSSWSGSSWSGSSWSGNSWSGSSWSGSSWSGNSWSGSSWSGNSWSGAGWGV
jgi:serine protease AprX